MEYIFSTGKIVSGASIPAEFELIATEFILFHLHLVTASLALRLWHRFFVSL